MQVLTSATVDAPVAALGWLDSDRLVVADTAGALHRWRPTRAPVPFGPTDGTAPAGCTALGIDGSGGRVAVGHEDGTVVVVDRTGRECWRTHYREPVTALAFETGGSGVLAVAAGHDVAVIDEEGGVVVAEWLRPTSVACLCWIDPLLLAMGGRGGVTFLPLEDRSLEDLSVDPGLPPQFPSPGVVLDLCLDASGTWLTASDLRGEVRLTHLGTGDELSLDGLGDRARGASWFGGDRLLAVAADDELCLWERAPFDLEPEPWAHGPVSGPSAGPDPSADGRLVVVGGHDGSVLVVSADDPSHAATVAGLDGSVLALAWHPERPELAVGTSSGALWTLSG